MSTENVFGKRLKERRELKNMSKQELADAVGVSRPNILFYEDGRNDPSLKIAGKLADALGVTLDYLMGRTNKPSNVYVDWVDLPASLANLDVAGVSLSKECLDEYGYIKPEVEDDLLRLVLAARHKRAAEKAKEQNTQSDTAT
jgi:transcriptional regulator with XRE-family HTH domain